MNLALSHLHTLGHRKVVFFIDSATMDKQQMIDNLAFLQRYSRSVGMVHHTVEALLARIEDRKTEEVLLHPFLSMGASTGPLLKKH